MSTQSLRFTCAGKPAPGNVASAGSGRLFPDRHRMQYWRSSNEDSEASGPPQSDPWLNPTGAISCCVATVKGL